MDIYNKSIFVDKIGYKKVKYVNFQKFATNIIKQSNIKANTFAIDGYYS